MKKLLLCTFLYMSVVSSCYGVEFTNNTSTPQALTCYNPVDKETGKILEWTCSYVITHEDGTIEVKEQPMGHM